MVAEKKIESNMNTKKWYIVKTKANCEFKSKNSVESLIKIHQLTQYVGDILIPEKEVVEVVRGKKTTRSKKFYPGYVFIQMDLTDKVWHLIKGVSSIMSFVGGNKQGYPQEVPISQIEVIQDQVKADFESPEIRVAFSVGENVVVIDGPFKGFSGVVREVNQEKGRIKIEVSIFGGPTPVELDFDQVHSES